jgi:hypothetical protein
MFSDRMLDVALRKERLIARSEGQRTLIAEACRRWREPARVIDRAWAGATYLRAHPALIAIGVAAAMILGRRSLFRWAGRGLVAWRAWRSVAGWVRRFDA